MDLFSLFLLNRAHRSAESASEASLDAHRVATDLRGRVESVEDRLERLTLLCVALAELAIEGGVLTEAQLKERVAAVDARDGRVDGRLSGAGPSGGGTVLCPHCGRMKGATRPRCVWCGKDSPVATGWLG